jgi:hypothetical protein
LVRIRLALLVLALIGSAAGAQSAERHPLPTNTLTNTLTNTPTNPNANAGSPPASEGRESLSESIQRRREFPFKPRCDGNTQEMVACLWQERDRDDLRLRHLLSDEQHLEGWRQARLAVCRRAADRGAGGSIRPLLWLECENALNSTLIEQITSPLLR